MPATCKICNREFATQITNTHLKTHGVTTEQYKERFGVDSLSSKEYIKQRSLKCRGTNNPMYGKNHSAISKTQMSNNRRNKPGRTGPISDIGKQNIMLGVEKREEKYSSGELQRTSHNFTENDRKKISNSVKSYAKDHPNELSARGSKAYKTALKNDNWMAPMTRLKADDPVKYYYLRKQSSESIKKANDLRSKRLNEKILNNISKSNFSVLGDILSEKTGLHTYNLMCNVCKTKFSYTRQYFTDSKFNPECCPACFPRDRSTSIAEDEIAEYISAFPVKVVRNDRTILDGGREIDMYLPNINLAIEYNGLYWHSQKTLESANRDKHADYYKYLELHAKGVQLISIYEDEWIKSKNIVKSILRYKLGMVSNKIHARKCAVREITTDAARAFLNQNHIQGYNKSKVKLGLYFNGNIVAVMTFSKGNLSRKSSAWEIDRFASLLDTSVIGGANKLWNHFQKTYDPTVVVSYADNRWSNGKLYDILGFSFQKNTVPNYWYFKPNELRRVHRFTLRKNSSDYKNLTEYENRLLQGYLRIWDCGSSKWIWEKSHPEKPPVKGGLF